MRRLNPYDELYLIGNELKKLSDTSVCEYVDGAYQSLLTRLMDATSEVCAFLTNCSVDEAELYRKTSMAECAVGKMKQIWETMLWSNFNGDGAQYPFGAIPYLLLCYDEDVFSDIYNHRMHLTKVAKRYRADFLKSCLDAVVDGTTNESVSAFLEANENLDANDIAFMLEAHNSSCLFYQGW